MKYLKFIASVCIIVVIIACSVFYKSITGIVLNEQNQPLPGATIQEKGTSNAVVSDANGKFKIEVQNLNAVLIITAVGYRQKEIKLGINHSLKVVLKSTKSTLDEVVVVGMGMKKRKDLVGSVANVLHPPTAVDAGKGLVAYEANASIHRSAAPMKTEDWRQNNNFNREGYDHLTENPFLKSASNPLSTFSIDVDGASYSNIRRFITSGQLPPDGAVRIEEMVNYFSYKYPQPTGDAPFSINTEYTVCPWNEKHQLVSIGLQGKKIATENLPAANIVFLIDVSGSMWSADKLPLVQSSMKLLADQLRPQDKVAMVVYAGNAGVVLPATEGNETTKIKDAIGRLQAGGSTAGGAGIALAYKIAQENFIKGGNNRIVLCTDGDFNVGQSSDDELERMIEEKRKSGVYLTVLGFGTGNYQDAKMQKLANKGNGNHAYIDNLSEARKVLISQFGGTMFTIAKDVKLQIEFNPARVQGYRLIGYENRMLAKEDFNDDQKDAGELGSGHTVTALYEIIPVGIEAPELKNVDDLKYQNTNSSNAVNTNTSNEVMTVKFRYKKPDGDKSLLLQKIVSGNPIRFAGASDNIHLAAGVAQFGMLLRHSAFKGNSSFEMALNAVSGNIAFENDEYREELLQLIKAASKLDGRQNEPEEISYYSDPLIKRSNN